MHNINAELHVAAETGDLSLIKSLLERGADVNYQDEYGYCAVLRTVHGDYSDCMQLLIDHGANPDFKNSDGYFALWWSIFFRHQKCLTTLIKGGADLNIQNNCGQTALHLACDIGYLEGVKLLADHGADFAIPDFEDIYPIDIARLNNWQDIVSFINSYHEDKFLDQAFKNHVDEIAPGLEF